METDDKPQTMQDVCAIRIGFAVKSDDEAIEYKKKISEILSPIPNVRIEFSLTSIPIPIKPNAG